MDACTESAQQNSAFNIAQAYLFFILSKLIMDSQQALLCLRNCTLLIVAKSIAQNEHWNIVGFLQIKYKKVAAELKLFQSAIISDLTSSQRDTVKF